MLKKNNFDGKVYISLLCVIGDGKKYSVAYILNKLDISKETLNNLIKNLQTFGLSISYVEHNFFQLDKPIELLTEEKIRLELPKSHNIYIHDIDILFNTSSTNTYLLKQTSHTHGKVIFAEYQSRGKGCFGREWLSPIAGGIYLTIGWDLKNITGNYGILSLYASVAVARALKKLGLNTVQLKWPNDILINNRKLGGILLESHKKKCGTISLVIGVGINYDLPIRITDNIEQKVTDISKNTKSSLSRNKIAAYLLYNIYDVFGSIKKTTKNSILLDEWRKYNFHKNKKVILSLPNKKISGSIIDISDDGALIISTGDKVKHYSFGEISINI